MRNHIGKNVFQYRYLFEICILVFFFSATQVWAEVVEYELIVAHQDLSITEKRAKGMTINGHIPGPVLYFKEGDWARIHVSNRMNVSTSIHWHGILVPPDMDGVPYISFPPIKPKTTFTYEFPIRQSGTYWYHSHSDLQEQSGVYGAFVIYPYHESIPADRDYTILLSDWTDEDPHEVLRTLKRGSEWYSIQKASGQSILGAARLGMLGDYFKRELQRMPPMDISDVAYDRFLANGKPSLRLHGEPGETLRLRIVDGSATTYFHLEFAGGPMTIISTDGQNVQPFEENRFLISVAETYDVLVQIPSSGLYEFRATAHDGSGHASVWIGSGPSYYAPKIPKPNLYHTMESLSLKRLFSITPAGTMGMSDRDVELGKFDQPGMMDMKHEHGMDHRGTEATPHLRSDHSKMGIDSMDPPPNGDLAKDPQRSEMGMTHSGTHPKTGQMDHPISVPEDESKIGNRYGTDFGFLSVDISASDDLAMDGMDPGRPWPPYGKLRSLKPTAFTGDKPIRKIRLTLDGDMERYVWFLNNKPLSESDAILIREGEIVQFIMINRTMMHHPMHLHGHFFRVINGQGDHAPLKHTVDVAPMSTTVIEFDANEFGDWFFHCHLLYHMKSGMARLIHYDGYEINPELSAIRPKLFKDPWYVWMLADVQSNMTDGHITVSNTRNIFDAEWEVGWRDVDGTGWEGTVTWNYFFNRFFQGFIGGNSVNKTGEENETRGVIGIRYLLPLNVLSRVWVDTDGGARFMLDKEFTITPRLNLLADVEYDTHHEWEGRVGISYLVTKQFSLMANWHSEYQWGVGLRVRF